MTNSHGLDPPEMRKVLVVANPQHAPDLGEKFHSPRVQYAFIVGGELGQIMEDL
jgi:hypothetical protein